MILRILIGLVGLGIVVLIHELGHFIVARLVGVEVEAFSIGWGRPFFKKKIGTVEYRLGIFPAGGYCQMKGEAEFHEALVTGKKEIPREKGTFYGTPPLKRMLVALAGPAFNFLFAVLVLAFVWGLGIQYRTNENRIVLASELDVKLQGPADTVGLRTGDRIVSVNGESTPYAQDVQEKIAPYADKKLRLAIDRAGTPLSVDITPKLDTETGAGRIGVYFWTDTVISKVQEGSPSAIAGLKADDRIVSANGMPIANTIDFSKAIKAKPAILPIEYNRKGIVSKAELVLSYGKDGNADLGLDFKLIDVKTPMLSPLSALKKGAYESWNTFSLTFQSFALFFKGINFTTAVSGPVRITYLVGDVAAQGFGQSFSTGLSSVANFLALISVVLALMNLLPIPALDGGLLVLFLIELFTRKPPQARRVYLFQLIGSVIIFGLLIFSFFGDILFLLHR